MQIPPAGDESSVLRNWLERRATSNHKDIICRRMELAQQRSQSTADQVYNAMSTTEGLVTDRASFLAIWNAMNKLSQGDLDRLQRSAVRKRIGPTKAKVR